MLDGIFGEGLKGMQSLAFVDLSSNRLVGTIPQGISRLPLIELLLSCKIDRGLGIPTNSIKIIKSAVPFPKNYSTSSPSKF